MRLAVIPRGTELLSRFPLQPVDDVLEGLVAAAVGHAGIGIQRSGAVRDRTPSHLQRTVSVAGYRTFANATL
jgi:hypothetical protein